jgi:hypothetical protein
VAKGDQLLPLGTFHSPLILALLGRDSEESRGLLLNFLALACGAGGTRFLVFGQSHDDVEGFLALLAVIIVTWHSDYPLLESINIVSKGFTSSNVGPF